MIGEVIGRINPGADFQVDAYFIWTDHGWHLCQGTLRRDEYPVLYSFLADSFGEVDEEFFSLPDLRGRREV